MDPFYLAGKVCIRNSKQAVQIQKSILNLKSCVLIQISLCMCKYILSKKQILLY